ncbi:cation diffusion facilitator family transporter [Pyruvatibacter sp.]|uniref:cation diffusion facilitator family transporter n=1 Tax=Pyruvatibacter sp. TaxID=1981328 RepID=UPI0032F00618
MKSLDTPRSFRRHVTPERAATLMKRATYASVAVALVLISMKAWAVWITGSMSLLATFLDSVLDGAASLVNLVAVRVALTPADRQHRFGHGKAEALAGLGQAALIGASALFLTVESISRLLDPAPVERSFAGISIIVISLGFTLALVTYQRYVQRLTGSLAIAADSLHYASDVLLNIGVIAALIIAGVWGISWADPLIALALAAWIGHAAWEIVSRSTSELMDRELPHEDRLRIEEIALAHPQVHTIHDLRTRTAGRTVFIQFHLEIPGDMPLRRAHAIADEVEMAIASDFPDAEILIHQDPAGHEDVPESMQPESPMAPGASNA